MQKVTPKLVVIVLLFAFILLALPNLNFAEKKKTKNNITVILAQSGHLFSSLFPWLNIASFAKTRAVTQKNQSQLLSVKILAEISIGRPGTGD